MSFFFFFLVGTDPSCYLPGELSLTALALEPVTTAVGSPCIPRGTPARGQDPEFSRRLLRQVSWHVLEFRVLLRPPDW
jgi:hypothetical protein